jgi:clan AA aspartic protease (TIGR02281 family)
MTAVLTALLLPGCSVLRFTGETVALTGKVVTTTVKTTGTVVTTTGKVVGSTARASVGTVRFFSGWRTVELERDGRSLYVRATVNRRHQARLLVDTGATSVQITPECARRVGIDLAKAAATRCTLADGSVADARSVTLNRVDLGSVEVNDVAAVVLLSDTTRDADGLLGMSFLQQFEFRFDVERNRLYLKYRPTP